MDRSTNHAKFVLVTALWITALLAIPSASWADDFSKAEQLYADHCAVCHGADRGGYIAPALNSDQTQLTPEQVRGKIQM
jgi:mono/diheme cytochrome c family protein